MELRPYQQAALQAIADAEARGVRCQALVLATGLGKTVIFSHLLAQRGGRALVLAHRDELLQQAAQKIAAIYPGCHVGIVRGDLDQREAQIVVASVQTLARARRLARIRPDFKTVIVDEAHHSAAESYGRIFEHIAQSDPLLIGVTATPDRADGKGLDKWFSEIVFEMGLDAGIREGWLCDLEGKLILLKDADFSKVHVKKGDYDLSELAAVMKAANWHEHVARAFFEHAADRRTVIFVPKVQMAHELAEHLRANGARAEAIDGSQPLEERRRVLRRLASGEAQVIVNCAVLTEGFDEPSLSCVMMARPTKSRALYTQCVGRGTRLHQGKQNCLVLDMVGVTQRHDLVTLATLAGVGQLRSDETYAKAAERSERENKEAEQKRQRQDEDRRRLEAELEARRINLLKSDHAAADHRPGGGNLKQAFYWQHSINGVRTLRLSDRTIVVRPMADGSWLASDSKQFRFIGATAEVCQQQAEAHARSLAFGGENARWRQKPASEKQLARLRQWRIAHAPNITAGEASDLIGQWIARKQVRL